MAGVSSIHGRGVLNAKRLGAYKLLKVSSKDGQTWKKKHRKLTNHTHTHGSSVHLLLATKDKRYAHTVHTSHIHPYIQRNFR